MTNNIIFLKNKLDLSFKEMLNLKDDINNTKNKIDNLLKVLMNIYLSKTHPNSNEIQNYIISSFG